MQKPGACMNRSREEESDTHAHKNISREGERNMEI